MFDQETMLEPENMQVASVYGISPSRFSDNYWGETMSARMNTKGSSASGKKKVEKINLHIEAEKTKKESQCGCL